MKWPFARATREPGWLVVSLRPTELSFVHGQYAPGGTSVIDRYGTRALEGDFEGVQRLAKELGLDRYQCSTLLDPGEYQLLLVEAPNVPAAELKTAIRWRIKDLLDYHVDDATVDVLEVPRNPAGGERGHSMYAVTARNDVVKSCIGRFEAAHIPLTVIDIEETAQRNVAALFERDERGLALLHLGEEQGLLTINYQQELVLARRIEVGMRALLAGGRFGARGTPPARAAGAAAHFRSFRPAVHLCAGVEAHAGARIPRRLGPARVPGGQPRHAGGAGAPVGRDRVRRARRARAGGGVAPVPPDRRIAAPRGQSAVKPAA